MNNFGHSGEPQWVAVIGDVVGSRTLTERSAAQRRIIGALADLRDAVGDGAAAPFVLTAGDEIQALLRRPAAAAEAVVRLADALYPVRIAWGLGYGTLATDLGPEPALLDGPCFHAARTAVGEARRRDRWVVARGFGSATDAALSALFALQGLVRSRWTETQARYAAAARTQLQKDVAAEFGVSPSVVSESLKAAGFAAVRDAETACAAVLGTFGTAADAAVDEEERR